ncbi:MAG: ribonuclease HI [Clostridia bacterium]|nr:ribonuclease HI [Clostridia bacterium]
MKQVTLYTDGACSGNPGPGGWGAILVWRGIEKVLSGGEPETTNNRMELTAVIRGLSALREPCEVTLVSDSKYVLDALSEGWAEGWRASGWKKGKAKNPDLWATLLDLTARHRMSYRWIKGHNGHPYNERCDRLATEAAARLSPSAEGQGPSERPADKA